MAKSKSYSGLVIVLLLLAAGGGGAWYFLGAKTEKKTEFQTVKVARGDIVQSVTATGDLQPVVTVDVGAQVSGQIKEVMVDYNSKVKAGDVLARIDESTFIQRLRQAEADLESTKANNQLLKLNVDRTTGLHRQNLVSQAELDNVLAQLAQSNAQLLTRGAAVENAKVDLSRCVITAPIDGMILDRRTDKGRTVNANMNAPVLFTLVNDLTKMQINAAVAEADIGTIAEGQEVKFTVDAFPNRTFPGKVRMVRNAASVQQSVVSYATIIDVANEDLRLKPGMTANVSIIVQQRPNVLRVANGALRVRVPQELLVPAAPGETKAGGKAGTATPTMTDEEQMTAIFGIIRAVGWERGTPPSPEQIEKAKVLAKEKGLDPDLVAARMSMGAGRKGGGSGGPGGPGGGDRGSRGGGPSRGPSSGGGAGERGFNNTVVTRTLYVFADPDALEKRLRPVSARLGVSDGFFTEVLEGLKEGDTIITGVILPGAAPVPQGPPGGSSNPFSGRSSFGGSSSGRGGPPR
jgi:HlyD family secretion protein